MDTTAWGRVPSVQALVNAFSSGQNAREIQDVGLDGMNDELERTFIAFEGNETQSYLDRISSLYGTSSNAYTLANQDPAADNYHFFYGSDYDSQGKGILERYKLYNGLDGNSPIQENSQSSYTQLPDVEDINNDYTLSEAESYYNYTISMRPEDLDEVGSNFITSIIENTGINNDTRWIQFKVPIRSFDKKIGSIPDFKSIRFMRIFVKGFQDPTVFRFATLDMVRGEWRKYLNSLIEPGMPIENTETTFDVSVVNLEENGRRSPINYVLPPGIEREQILGSTNVQQQNEQSISYRLCDLKNGDARGAFKNVTMDMRTYNKIKFFVHAEEKDPIYPLNDGDLTMFIRLGSDYSANYYEYEIPLKITDWGSNGRGEVWPLENQVEIDFDVLINAKNARNNAIRNGTATYTEPYLYSMENGKQITIIGNPNLGNVRTIMLGVRNPDLGFGDDDSECAEIWINESRLTDFDERGGYAAKGQLKTRLADLGSMTLAGNMSTVGFGSLEQSVTERNKEETRQYNLTSNIELGKLFPEHTNVRMPLFFGMSETVLTPQFNPLDPDVELQETLSSDDLSQGARDTLKSVVQNYTMRRSINLTNVRKERSSGKGKKESKDGKELSDKGGRSKQKKNPSRGRGSKNRLYDIENITLSYSYNETFNRNINTEFSRLLEHSGGLGYNFNNNPKNYKPFSKMKLFKKAKYFRLLKDFNFSLLPKTISYRVDFNKSYSETKMRNLASLNALNSVNIVEPDTMFNKQFNLTQNYAIKYDLARSLKLNFSANMRSIIDEPEGKIDTQAERDALRDSIFTFGRPTMYHHQFDLRYTLPLNKFPLTDWINLTVNYDGTYDWNAGSIAMVNDSINLGNVIQNTNKKRINAQLNMKKFYKHIPLLKEITASKNPRGANRSKPKSVPKDKGRPTADSDDELSEDEEEEEEKNPLIRIDQIANFIFCIQNINLSYDETSGTMIPGFLPSTGFLGFSESLHPNSAPGLGFLLGEQPDASILDNFAANGWITTDTLLNQQLTQQYTSRLNIRSTIEPINKFRIQITAQRSETQNSSQLYRNMGNEEMPDFQSLNKNVTGSFNMSFLAIGTAFRPMNLNSSETFDELRFMRTEIANRVAQQNGVAVNSSQEYPVGFGPNSQEVLIPSFMAAYSGTSASSQTLNKFPKVPMPNWNIKFDGLIGVPWIKKRFKTFSISHGYSSTYSINSYQTNLFYNPNEAFTGTPENNPENFDVNGDYISQYQIQTVSISEQFSPLIKLDLTMNNSLTTRFEISKDRQVSLSLSNNQIQEQSGKSFTLGVGYRVTDFEVRLSTSNGPRTFSSNLDLNVDVSIRKTASVIRSIEENTHQAVSGSTDISVKTAADYVLSERVSLQLFYDRMVKKYQVANSWDTANSSFGLKLRFSFGS